MPILTCTCQSPQQDALHGAGRRVHNKTAKKDPPEYRCTVCCTTRGKSGAAPVDKKKKK